ncbi:MAG: hypothetical protein HYY92_03455 [Parcubacteria group bacterium]|nr:hypothetical protein [Parcubacteria group bacterium]
MMRLEKDAKLVEGKTKIIWRIKDRPNFVLVESKDDITAGDGKKHDQMKDKALFSNTVTCDVFRFLQKIGIPLAFVEQVDGTQFLAHLCDMLPYEVVVRNSAYGSYWKRNPEMEKGQRLPDLVVEFFLKTANKKWNGQPIPCDDPLIVMGGEGFELYRPDIPVASQKPFLSVHEQKFSIDLEYNPYAPFETTELFSDMSDRATYAFEHLAAAWGVIGCHLADFKVEFGFDRTERLVLADVIDPDSWRLLDADGEHLDKQPYRDGAPLEDVRRRYQKVAELSCGLQLV